MAEGIIMNHIIYLIRHAQTEANALGKYIGVTDEPLSSEGIKELETYIKGGCYPSVDYVFTYGYLSIYLRWVAPFGYLRVDGCLRLSAAFRSLPRPSSAPGAKAFALCSL